MGLTKVAFVSFRLKTQDGVSAETENWLRVFKQMGFEVFRVAGYIPDPEENDFIVPELNPQDPQIESFQEKVFDSAYDPYGLRQEMAWLDATVERGLLPVLRGISPDLIVAANIFSLPLNVPLTMVLYRYLQEEEIACIAHHHDFYWQNQDFAGCVLEELTGSHFPPALPQIRHVTTNEWMRDELMDRTGISAVCIRNRLDFSSPRMNDGFNDGLRRDLGIAEDEIMFLHPARASLNEGVDRAISFVEEFARAGNQPARLVVTGACDDGFASDFRQMCNEGGAGVLHVPGWPGLGSYRLDSGASHDSFDAYTCADIVVCPASQPVSIHRVMESVRQRRLVLVDGYPWLDELRAIGFQFLSFDDQAVSRTLKLLEYPSLMAEMTDRNFEIGKRHFGLENLRDDLAALISKAVFR